MLGNNASLIYGILMSSGMQSSADLARRTGLSQPVISRAISELCQHTDRLVIHRDGRSIGYAIIRQIYSLPFSIPIYIVSDGPGLGSASLLGNLMSLEGGGMLFNGRDGKSALFDGLPWFLQDMRPQGFIGRAFCHAHAETLGLSDRLSEWSNDDVIHALSAFSEDTPGNLIVGDGSLRRYLNSFSEIVTLPDEARAVHALYDSLADSAMQGSAPGSSAAGEHPKFLSRYRIGHSCLDAEEEDFTEAGKSIRNVIVKFSPKLDGSAVSARWRDLLIAEHVASKTLASRGIDVPETRIVQSAARCYLESERFDRIGLKGRVGVVSFEAIDNAFVGARHSWSASAQDLCTQGMIDAACLAQIQLIEQFGKLIANTDMHFGNMSFYSDMRGERVNFRLAPVYDMLPMLYAPEKSEIVIRNFNPSATSVSETAIEMASEFWNALSERHDISDEFKQIAAQNSKLLAERFAFHAASGI